MITAPRAGKLSGKDSQQDYAYEPLDPAAIIPRVLEQFRNHAIVIWIFTPLCIGLQWLSQVLRPTCKVGYSDVALVFVGLALAHHLYSESKAWEAAKNLLAPPEVTVMRHLGVLRRRRRLVILGLLEDLDLYTDMAFPLIAHSCDLQITDHWLRSWRVVPVVGRVVAPVLEQIKFWGSSAILVSIVMLWGIYCTINLIGRCSEDAVLKEAQLETQTLRNTASTQPHMQMPRIDGQAFYALARLSEPAVMPSVALLCEEMGRQRKWVFDEGRVNQGTFEALKARQDITLGKADYKLLAKLEIQNHEVSQRVETASKMYSMFILFGRVLIGNAAQLWLQASFFQLAFDGMAIESRVKLIIGMAISALTVIVRSRQAATSLGCIGVFFSMPNLILVLWSFAKIVMAYKCEDHVWNITSGCIDLSMPL